MNVRSWIAGPWLASRIRGQEGIYRCAAWFALLALASFAASILETGTVEFTFTLAVGGLHAFAALGLLRGLKSGWHIAAFLAFMGMALNLLATACAPGEIADGDKRLYEAAIDIAVLAISVTVFTYLRKPVIRRLYGVPESYRVESPGGE